MSGHEYVHALGAQIEICTESELRVQLARLLASTGSADAQPYILDAIAEETDETARESLRKALAELERLQGEG
ncbi:MAG: hypothetical protein IBX62_08150 [Coriobacteriia bacterium]|nr:hypothetical protein [Coriobacteriia bacterium]